jgi:hypothetical protein
MIVLPVTVPRSALQVAAILPLFAAIAEGHDYITTAITFDREIVRIVHARCARCHRPGGEAFSLLTYKDARPWAEAIKEEVLSRRMPPWGAVKGFGEFRNDQGLTAEQLEQIVSWTGGGVPEGEAKDVPPLPDFGKSEPQPKPSIVVRKDGYVFTRLFTLAGLLPVAVPKGASMQIVAERPDGSIEPLVWLYEYDPTRPHVFWLEQPLALPAGTVLRGLDAGTQIGLLTAPKKAAK